MPVWLMYMEFETCDTTEYSPIPAKLSTEKLSSVSDRLLGQSLDNQGFSIWIGESK